MKKFFTLIACALVAGSAFAQNWTDSETTEGWEEKQVINNGKITWNNLCADGDFANYPASKLTNFVVNEWIDGEKVDVGTARVTVDPIDADAFADAVDAASGFNALNYCIKVVSRDAPKTAVMDEETGEQKVDPETGEPVWQTQNIDAWDSQFFITFGEDNPVADGYKVKLTMDVKADKAAKASTQLHLAPGAYKHYSAVGDINFTTEWETFENEFTVDGNGATSYTIALNLAELKEANTYYFDNINVVISREKELTEDVELYDKTIPEGWSDLIVNGDFEDAEGGVANFVAHDYVTFDGEKQEFVPTRVIADPNEANNNKCIVVTTDANPKQEYDAQLFITVPEAQHFNEGDVIRLRMRVKADVAQSAGTQCHAAPGSYIFYQCAGTVKFQKVWTNFDSGEITVTKQMMQSNSNPGPFRTIALNLSKVAAGNNIYFDDVQLLIKEPEDPTIGLRSDLSIAITKGTAASDFMKTEDSYKAVVDAVDEGQLVLDNTDATAEELQAATKAINDAFAGLTYVEGYTPVTAAMFKKYASVDEPGDGEATGCAFSLYDSVDLPYGDGSVGELNWADLSDYDELVVVKTGDIAPRILMNRLVKDGQQAATQEESQMLDINDNAGNSWSADKYQTIVDDNVFIINLKAIVEDYGFARLHSIKKQGWAAGVTVTDLIVGKGTTTEIGSFVAEKAAPKAIFNVAGQQIKSLQKGLNIVNGEKVYVK
jgi:hypothetical protein